MQKGEERLAMQSVCVEAVRLEQELSSLLFLIQLCRESLFGFGFGLPITSESFSPVKPVP